MIKRHARGHRRRPRRPQPAAYRASRRRSERPGGSACRALDRKAEPSLIGSCQPSTGPCTQEGTGRRTIAYALPGRKARHCGRRAGPAARHARRRRLAFAIGLRLGIGARLPVRAGLPVRVARHRAWRPSKRSTLRFGFLKHTCLRRSRAGVWFGADRPRRAAAGAALTQDLALAPACR